MKDIQKTYTRFLRTLKYRLCFMRNHYPATAKTFSVIEPTNSQSSANRYLTLDKGGKKSRNMRTI